MSQTLSPVQWYGLLKSCVIIFLIQAVIVFLAPVMIDVPIEFRLLILAINLLVSVVLGWPLYKRIYHMIFTYDDKIFTLKKGKKEEVSHTWKEFSRVSLIRTEEGNLSLRLYHNAEFFDLPASKLKLNPFDFRFEVMKLVSSDKDKKVG